MQLFNSIQEATYFFFLKLFILWIVQQLLTYKSIETAWHTRQYCFMGSLQFFCI